ncbi:MAG: NAD-dependent epimerase/dehydratase family protein [Pseudomonadota bacterium]
MRHRIIEDDMKELVARDLPWEKFSGKTVLVTGAYGSIPAYMIEALLHLNQCRPEFDVKVLAMGRSQEKFHKRFARDMARSDVQFIAQDVATPLHLSGPVDYIIHGAGWASPKYYGAYPVEVMAPNVLGTHHLLQLAHDKKVAGFLFISSAEIYGAPPPSEIPVRESYTGNVDPAALRSCYAEAKRIGETMCVSWHHEFGVPAKIARVFHTYGPGMALDDGRVFADFVADVVAGRDIVMRSDGSAIRAYCYLADAVDGLFRILLQGDPAVAYNLGNDEAECSVAELAQTLIDAFPEKGLKLRHGKSQGGGYLKSHVQRICPDTTRLRSLGWSPRYSIREGFSRMVRSYGDDTRARGRADAKLSLS